MTLLELLQEWHDHEKRERGYGGDQEGDRIKRDIRRKIAEIMEA